MDKATAEKFLAVLERIAISLEDIAAKRVKKGTRTSNGKYTLEVEQKIHLIRGKSVTIQDAITAMGLVATDAHDYKSVGWALRRYSSRVFKRGDRNIYEITPE